MKSVLAFMLAMVVVTGINAQSKNDWYDMQLKGKVKSIKTKETHRYKKNGVFTEWEKSYSRLTQFNPTGFRTEYTEYYANDSISYKITYKYNGRDKTAELSYFDKLLKPTVKKTHKLDDKGRLSEILEYSRDGELDRRYAYAYDDRGNLAEVIYYKKDGTLGNKTTYKYDDKNNRTEWKLETPGYATSSRKFIHDDKGNMTEETWHNGKGEIDFRFVRTYDANGNKIQELKYKGATQLLDMTKWNYEYDKKGNWIKKIDLTSDGIDFHTEERTIVYY